MRVATYENGTLCFLTDPFYVDKHSNEICYYPAGKEKEDVDVYKRQASSSARWISAPPNANAGDVRPSFVTTR